MTADQQIDDVRTIEQAYREQLAGMFGVFFQGCVQATKKESDVAELAAATSDRFERGLEILRAARDRALKIVSESE